MVPWLVPTKYVSSMFRGDVYLIRVALCLQRSKVELVEPMAMVTGATMVTQEDCKRSHPFDAGPSGR